MTAEADAGDIVAQQAIDIEPEDTALTLYRRIVKVGVDLLIDAYPAVLVGAAPRIPQDHARATVFPRRRPEDGRVEWTWPAGRVADTIRAVTHPYPGAFVGDGDRKSTRLNSSHGYISYAVFCLKKKKTKTHSKRP